MQEEEPPVLVSSDEEDIPDLTGLVFVLFFNLIIQLKLTSDSDNEEDDDDMPALTSCSSADEEEEEEKEGEEEEEKEDKKNKREHIKKSRVKDTHQRKEEATDSVHKGIKSLSSIFFCKSIFV